MIMRCVLVSVQDYPNNNGGVKLMYVHTRNLQYIKNDISVTVLNFSCDEEYEYENVRVIPYKTFALEDKKYDIAIVHAANLKNHYRFLKKHGEEFERFIFFFHGHEVLSINNDYSEPYDFVKRNALKTFCQDVYDKIKFGIWRRYYVKVAHKSDYIFVSEWMKAKFFKNLKLSEKQFDNKIHITYNNVGLIFEKKEYDDLSDKEYDFITIRANLDDSKYSIDIVNRLASNTPTAKFLVIGKGVFFNYIKKSDNLSWIDTTLNHEGIVKYLDCAKFALMPTRTDAQGLMMCEMAAFGIPVITSDIPVCHEVFDGFSNAYFIDNDDFNLNLNCFIQAKSECVKDHSYYLENTIKKELGVIFNEK